MNLERTNPPDPLDAAVEKAVADVREHADAVLILTCREGEGGETQVFFLGAGLAYALKGMAQDFLAGNAEMIDCPCMNGGDEELV